MNDFPLSDEALVRSKFIIISIREFNAHFDLSIALAISGSIIYVPQVIQSILTYFKRFGKFRGNFIGLVSKMISIELLLGGTPSMKRGCRVCSCPNKVEYHQVPLQ